MLQAYLGIFAAAGAGGPSGPSITTANIFGNDQFRSPTAPCVAGSQIRNTGDMARSNNAGSYFVDGVWLVTGLNSEVWVERTLDSGTLTTDHIGSGRLSLVASPISDVRRSTNGFKTCTLTYEFFDAASMGNSLGSKQIVLTATYEDDSE